MHHATRVKNEVGIMNMARKALEKIKPEAVPVVFAWASGATSQGWILQEFKEGAHREDAEFKTMSLAKQKVMVREMAEILQGLQSYDIDQDVT